MVGVCCGCIAKPASVQPRKTYNTLMGQLFAGEPIATDEAIDSTMRRKIQKLQEYVQANPAKIPKVSRRLMRRIRATLLKPGDNLGYVKVAVHAYAYLLARSTDEISSYSPGFFSKELLSSQDAVVPLLLRDIHIEMRTLGAELLAVFIKVQTAVDSQLEAIQAHVPLVCRAAQAALRSDRSEQRLQEAAERRRAGDKLADKLAVPNPVDLVTRRDPAHIAALEAACLRCLRELVALCRRHKVVPKHIAAIQAVMLDNLRSSRDRAGSGCEPSAVQPPSSHSGELPGAVAASTPRSAGDGASAAAQPAPPPGCVVDTAFYSALGVTKAVPSGFQPRELAEGLLLQMASYTRDIAMVGRILDSFYGYMDERHRWQEQDVVKDFLAVLSASGSEHHYPMFASLLRHAASRKLAAADCGVVLRIAAEQGVKLHPAYSLAALALALDEAPRAWTEQARRGPRVMPVQAFIDLLRAGTAAMRDLAHLPSISEPSAAPSPVPASPTAAADAGRSCSPTAAAAAAADEAGDGAAGAKGEPAAVFKQQLAQLREGMLAAVRLLAARVGTAEELCEAVAVVLAGVSSELRLPQHGHGLAHAHSYALGTPRGASAAGGAAGAGPFTAVAGAGASPAALGFAAAAGDAASAGSMVAAGGSGAELSEAAGVVMALECAAAATEAWVQPRQQLAGSAGGSPSSGEPAQADGLQLAGGVLPPSLVSAALPLLRAGPRAVRRAVQRILLTLLPGAQQGIASDRQAGELAEAVLSDLQRCCSSSEANEPGTTSLPGSSPAAEDSCPPSLPAMADALVRCCLRGPDARPSAALVVSRLLLRQQRLVLEGSSYRSVGAGSVARAHALLLLGNSQLQALAEATGSRSLLVQQLPLDPKGCPALLLGPRGLVVTGAVFEPAASAAALQALEQQRPPCAEHLRALQAALAEAPRLVPEFSEAVQQLAEEGVGARRSTTSSEGDRREKPLLTDKVNAMLMKRMSTLRKDLVHVSELLTRDSITRMQDIPSAAALAAGKASDAGSTPHGPAAKPAGAAGAGAHHASSLGASPPEQLSAAPAAAAVVSPEGVRLEGLQPAPAVGSDTLVSTVAAALQQPAPAGAFVVRDVKISRLAGELDALMG